LQENKEKEEQEKCNVIYFQQNAINYKQKK